MLFSSHIRCWLRSKQKSTIKSKSSTATTPRPKQKARRTPVAAKAPACAAKYKKSKTKASIKKERECGDVDVDKPAVLLKCKKCPECVSPESSQTNAWRRRRAERHSLSFIAAMDPLGAILSPEPSPSPPADRGSRMSSSEDFYSNAHPLISNFEFQS